MRSHGAGTGGVGTGRGLVGRPAALPPIIAALPRTMARTRTAPGQSVRSRPLAQRPSGRSRAEPLADCPVAALEH